MGSTYQMTGTTCTVRNGPRIALEPAMLKFWLPFKVHMPRFSQRNHVMHIPVGIDKCSAHTLIRHGHDITGRSNLQPVHYDVCCSTFQHLTQPESNAADALSALHCMLVLSVAWRTQQDFSRMTSDTGQPPQYALHVTTTQSIGTLVSTGSCQQSLDTDSTDIELLL